MINALASIGPKLGNEIDQIYEEYAEHAFIARKEKGNAKTHKNRLKEFQGKYDFR